MSERETCSVCGESTVGEMTSRARLCSSSAHIDQPLSVSRAAGGETLADLYGSAPDLIPNPMTSEAWVRRYRDGFDAGYARALSSAPAVSRAAGGETEGVSDAVMAWLLEQRAEAIDVRDGVPHYSLRYQHLDAVIRALSSAPAPEASELLDAARALVERIDLIHANDDYRGVWSLAFAHGHRYAGPTCEAELARLRAALGASAQRNTGEGK